MKTTTQSNSGSQKTVYTPLTKGDYKARLASLEVKKTKKGDGTIASASFELVGGNDGSDGSDKKGRRVFHTFLVDHPNSKAVGFSNNKLNKFLSATGSTSTIEDLSNDFSQVESLTLGKEISIGVDVNVYEQDGEMKIGNKITSFKRNQA